MSMLPSWYVTSMITVLGLLVGSFLNVVIYRVPAGMSLMGRSHCPKCDSQIRAYDNVPVLAWLWLRGKCRDCKAPISWRYPTIEFVHGLAWFAIASWQGAGALLPVLLYFASISIALAMIDFDTLRLPDSIVLPSWAVVGAGLAWAAWSSGEWQRLAHAGVCAAGWGIFFFLMWFLTRGRGLGFGDVKLAPILGAMTGYFSMGGSVIGVFAAFCLGGIPGAILLATKVVKRGTPIPFGPMLIAGAWVGIVWGPQLARAYLAHSGYGG